MRLTTISPSPMLSEPRCSLISSRASAQARPLSYLAIPYDTGAAATTGTTSPRTPEPQNPETPKPRGNTDTHGHRTGTHGLLRVARRLLAQRARTNLSLLKPLGTPLI